MIEIKKGLKIGKLTVLKEGERKVLPSGIKPRTVDCICDCGNKTNVLLLHFIRERTLSCGCIRKTKFGVSSTKIYRIYRAINERCDGKTKDKDRYLGRGITVCDLWKNNYLEFINWALANGYKQGLQIDRKDNNKGYSPENCRFVTPTVNANNRENTFKVIYKQKTYAFSDLVRELKRELVQSTIRRRIKRGWTTENAFNIPIKEGNYKKRC
jgi:hypothetical protein